MNRTITLENAFSVAVESLYCGDDLSTVQIDDSFTLELRLHGETWDGLLDYRVGDFLTTLQKDVFAIYNKSTNNNVSLRSSNEIIRPLTVKVCAQKKCLSLKLFFKFLSKAVPYMKSEDIAKVIIAAAVVTGLYFYEDIERDKIIETERIRANVQTELARIESNERIQKAIAESHVDLVKEVRQTVTESIDTALSAQQHKVVIAKHMDADDSIEINGIKLNKTETKNLFTLPKLTENPATTSHYIDGAYSILEANFEDHLVTLRIEGKPVKATTHLLDEASKKQLHDIYKQADLKDKIPYANLWIVAEIRGDELIATAVTGLGSKRPNSQKLSQIITAQKKQAKPARAIQLNLL